MSITHILIALAWGGLAGYLLLRLADSLLCLLFCLHGLLEWRWKTLANRSATGLIPPGLILKLALRLACYVIICGFLLEAADDFMRRTYQFGYMQKAGILFAVAGGGVLLSRIYYSWQRLKLVWRMTHEFDFAARRERTRLLKH